MNVKLHTPKTLRAGSGMSSTKQFLLSLLATTVSIVLTFGTAGIIDYNKKQSAKKEMVKMVLYDMDRNIELVEKADTAFHEAVRIQKDIALHPEHYDSLRFMFGPAMELITMEFPEVTEKIFSTSIETFNTIGDVNFVNEVSTFYMTRHKYEEIVLHQFRENIEQNPVALSQKSLFAISFPEFAIINRHFLNELKKYRNNCMRMMNVSEEDLIEFSHQHKSEGSGQSADAERDEMIKEYEDDLFLINQAIENRNN